MLLPMLASAQAVSDVQNSGCLRETRGEEPQRAPTIVLEKEGSILSVEVQNYISNCATSDFEIKSSISDGIDGSPCSLSINVDPVLPEIITTCDCPFNVSFTIRDFEPNSFYLDCWWYKGLVELTEGEPLVLEDIWEQITVDNANYVLRKAMLKAMLADGSTMKGEVVIPSVLSHEGQTYTVTSISESAFYKNKSITKVTIPQTIQGIDFDESYGFYYNLFSTCTALKSIEVEESNPVLCSVNGVLFNKEQTSLISYPANAGRTIYIVPGVTRIGIMAFGGCSSLETLDIPETVNQIGSSAFYGCNLDTLYIRGIIESDMMFTSIFNGMGTDTDVYVHPTQVDKFKAIYKGPVYPLSEQKVDYIPFVELGKQWHVVSADANPNYACHLERYEMSENVERDGKTYTHTYCLDDELNEYHDAGLFREENRRVYKYDETAGRDIMLYDFSLKEGDTFAYEFGLGQPVNCKVLKQGWLSNGPQIVSSCTLSPADTLNVEYRWLRTWTIGRDNGAGEFFEVATWVEGIGALENMFTSFAFGGVKSCLAYVERKDNETSYHQNEYLPFSFCNIYDVMGQVHGCDLPTGAEDNWESDGHHKLTYELEGHRLHVYGEAFTQCGPNNYAYFFEKPTDDPLVNKIEFVIQEVEPLADCVALHATDFYVPGFDPNMNYIVVDNHGEEQPVINKTPQMAYRPFIEDGKVWKFGILNSGNPMKVVDYYYFDGDTIIDGRTCKQMMCQRFVSADYLHVELPSLSKVGAWFEENQKVYFYDEIKQSMKLKYDFTLEANDTLLINNYYPYEKYVIGPKQSGGIEGFKGVYRDIMFCADEGQNIHSTFWLEGVGGVDGLRVNAYNPTMYEPALFLMSCAVGDEVIYLNDEYEDGATPDGARKGRFDFTHTIKTQPKAPRRGVERRVGTSAGIAQSLYGEYNDLRLAINLDPLDDAYLVRITDESGKVVYEKAVNAGTVVALSIDISAYAKGRYTVTIENSDESFTGQFEAQTSGIETIVNNHGEKDHHIYNLQGQRISSLQRGLNIMGGKKIIVK